MKRIFIYSMALITISLSACNGSQNNEQATTTQPTPHHMNNLISIVEIPVSDYARASTFYQTILKITITEMTMDGNQMGVLPNDSGTVNVVIVKGNDYKPTADGAVLYLNAGNDLQPTLDLVAKNGGQVIVPKTLISPEMGYFALFIDTEGNKLGLHSTN